MKTEQSPRVVWYILIGILLIGAGIRLWNLAGPDILTDDAHYSMRSLGYFDYMASTNRQTTPIVWFPEHVWWQGLSFHDAPPLVFAVQWFFFALGGDNVWAARLPFVLAGLLSIFAVFLLGRRIANDFVGLASALALAVIDRHVWISRIGFLDGFVVLFVALSLYFFLKAEEKPQNYLWWGIATGLGILTKYTFLFLGPTFLITLVTVRRGAWRQKYFYAGLAAFLIVIAPVVIYNTMMWRTRGHLDAALSTLVSEHPKDFEGLTRTTKLGSSFDIGAVIQNAIQGMSPGFRLFLTGSMLVGLWELWKKNKQWQVLSLGIVSGLVMLGVTGANDRYTAALLPIIVVFIGYAAFFVWTLAKRGWQRRILCGVFAFLFLWEGFFTVQSQLIPIPWVKKSLFLDATRPAWYGYQALEKYVQQFYQANPDPSYVVFSKTPQIFKYQVDKVQSLYAKGVAAPQQKHLLVFDDRMEWFATVWTFERRRIYNVAAIPSLTNFTDAIQGGYMYKFREFGFEDATIITISDAIPHETNQNARVLAAFADGLRKEQPPIQEIKNAKGEVAFSVFRVSLNKYK